MADASDARGVRAMLRRLAGPRWAWISCLSLLAFLAALVLFLAYVLPGILRPRIERDVSQALHRKLSIERIEIHPLSLSAAVQGLRLLEADGAGEFLSFQRLEVRASLSSLTAMAPVLREVRLSAPHVHLARLGPGRFSTDDIVAALHESGPAQKPSAPAAGAPPRFAVHNISISGGRFEFDDEVEGAHHIVEDFSLGVPFISSFASQEEVFVEPAVHALVDGAALDVKGEARPFASTRDASVKLDVDGIDLARYLGYLPAAVSVKLPSGTLDLHLQADIRAPRDGVPSIHLSGRTLVHGLALGVAGASRALKFKEVELQIAHAELPAGRLEASLTLNGKARLGATGTTAVSPLHADLALTLEDFDLVPFTALFADKVNLRLTRALAHARAKVLVDADGAGTLAGFILGDFGVTRLATVDVVNSNDFVDWDELALAGVRIGLAPLSVRVDRVALKNLYARVIISPEGRINLQDIVRRPKEAARSLTVAEAAGPGAAPAVPKPPQPSPPAGAPLPVSVGEVLVQGGHVRFTDNFIKPRYSADLDKLDGSVKDLSARDDARAAVDVKGEVNGAPLLIGGTFNPIAAQMQLDIRAGVHDMELAPLTPYSGKYVGYRIERGKMSFDVAYRLEGRELTAQNHLVLDQLSFGDKVDSPSATSLPVQLAIALLKDGNGVIDINLPIGGSLDDPQFSVGGVLLRVLVNLVTKAVTSPFALLGSLLGNSTEELSWVDFAPGESAVAPSIESRLKTLSGALAQRPGLKLDIGGWADPVADRGALQHARVRSKLRALKREDLVAQNALIRSAEVSVSPQEAPALLARVYESTIPAAERAAAGAPASSAGAGAPAPIAPIAPEAMEARLAAREAVADDDLRALGNARAQSVKAWLKTIGNVPEERLALVEAKIAQAPAPGDPASATATAAPVAGGSPPAANPPKIGSRVEFALH